MALPQHVRNRLDLGGDIAAKVKATRPDYYAWVYIKPITETSFYAARKHWTQERKYISFDHSIKGYSFRYIELSEWHLTWGWDLDHALRQRPTIDYQMTILSEEALEQILLQWCHDFSELGLPTDYPDPPDMY